MNETEKRRSAPQRRARRRRSSPLILILLCGVVASALLLLLVSIGSYRILLENAEREAALQTLQTVPSVPADLPPVPAAIQESTQVTIPTEADTPVMLSKYEALYQKNNHLFGWLKIEDTVIDYPVMHSPEEAQLYLLVSFDLELDYIGTPFLDGKCTAESDNLILYGNNMEDGSMFHSLLEYQNKDYWQQHPTITFDTLYQEQEFEILAAFPDRVYLKSDTCFKFYQFIDAKDEADFNAAIQYFKDNALYDTGVTAEYGDQLITLVTSAYHTENGRFVVVARKK